MKKATKPAHEDQEHSDDLYKMWVEDKQQKEVLVRLRKSSKTQLDSIRFYEALGSAPDPKFERGIYMRMLERGEY